ncbi:hypothetical protein B0T13DRAFT_392054, partial [Neurospora crassa]
LLYNYKDYYYTYINDIIFIPNTSKDYITYLIIIFNLFTFKNISLSPVELLLGYPNIKLLNFRVSTLGL